jgi:outer membrane lipoprotein carrier protein
VRSLLTTLLLAGLAVSPARLTAQAQPPAAELAARIQARYATVRDFTADFTLIQTSALVARHAQDRGRVSIKKPGKMRWVFLSGNKSEVIADGSQIYSYFPDDKLVRVVPQPTGDGASSPLLLLTGRGDLTRDFTPVAKTEVVEGVWRVTVTPKTPQPEFAELTLIVEPVTLKLRGMVLLDDQGAVKTFTFTNLRENQSVPDSTFVFTIPKGVEVRR